MVFSSEQLGVPAKGRPLMSIIAPLTFVLGKSVVSGSES